jgi:hypothetical protein
MVTPRQFDETPYEDPQDNFTVDSDRSSHLKMPATSDVKLHHDDWEF